MDGMNGRRKRTTVEKGRKKRNHEPRGRKGRRGYKVGLVCGFGVDAEKRGTQSKCKAKRNDPALYVRTDSHACAREKFGVKRILGGREDSAGTGKANPMLAVPGFQKKTSTKAKQRNRGAKN